MRKGRISWFLILITVVFFFPGFQTPLHAADRAAAFALPDLQGKSTSLEDVLQGKKAVLINFWATWCPSCRREIPELLALEARYAAKGFAVVGIDVGESAKKTEAFKNKYGISYPILLDAGSETAKQYKIAGLPGSILIDSHGEIVGRYHEYSEELADDVEKALS